MAKPPVSVIVPVFNAQKTVRTALNSVLRQTEKAFEIICVDDGSTDKTPAVLAEYARKDKRIRVITQSHQGAGAARNTGLSKARGRYVFFMDADDETAPTLLEQTLARADATKAQITIFDGGVRNAAGQSVYQSSSAFLARLGPVFSMKSMADNDKDDFYLETPMVPWNKLFERRFLIQNRIEFGTTHTSEDISFNLIALGLADRITYLPQTYYYYRAHRKKSLSARRPTDLPAAFIAVSSAEKRVLPVVPGIAYALKRYELFQCVTWMRRYMGHYPIRAFYKTVQNKLIEAQSMDETRLYRALDKPYFDVVRLRRYEEILYLTDGFMLHPPKGIGFALRRRIAMGQQKIRAWAGSMARARVFLSMKNDIRPIPPITPDAVPVVFAVDAPYVAPFSVALQSILDHRHPALFYDIVVLEKDLAEADKTRLQSQVQAYPGCSLRFWNVTAFMKHADDSLFYESAHISKTAYYRLFIPLIFKHYDRVLYLDSDLIVRRDVADLFRTPLSGKAIGAVRDFKLIKELYNPCHPGFHTIYPYLVKTLRLKNVHDYVNSGVLVMDTRQLRNMDFVGKALWTLWQLKEPMYHDQDIINSVAQGRICFLSSAWNMCWHVNGNGRAFETLPPSLYGAFRIGESDPFVIHYASVKKPWLTMAPSVWGAYFWQTAWRTPYAAVLQKIAATTCDETPFSSNRESVSKRARRPASTNRDKS